MMIAIGVFCDEELSSGLKGAEIICGEDVHVFIDLILFVRNKAVGTHGQVDSMDVCGGVETAVRFDKMQIFRVIVQLFFHPLTTGTAGYRTSSNRMIFGAFIANESRKVQEIIVRFQNLNVGIHVDSTFRIESEQSYIITHKREFARLVGFASVWHRVHIEIVLVPELVFVVRHMLMP